MQRELLLVDEMIGAAEQARALVNGVTLETLEDDRLRRDALLWNFTVIGEAASQLGPEIRSRFPDIDWAKPGKLRNRIVHGYWSVDLEILHTTATDELPRFVEQLRRVLSELEQEPATVTGCRT